MEKKVIRSLNAPAPIGPYNQAIQFGNLLFVSGQIAINHENGELYQGDIQLETEIVMKNIQAILDEAGSNFSQVLKATIFLIDMAQFSLVNEVYGRFFAHESAPARETVQVSALPKGAQVEISVIVGMN